MKISHLTAIAIATIIGVTSLGASTRSASAGIFGDVVGAAGKVVTGAGKAVGVVKTTSHVPPNSQAQNERLAKAACFSAANRNVWRMQEITATQKGPYDYSNLAEYTKLKDTRNAAIARCQALPGKNVVNTTTGR